jgi:DNA modification methylase
VLKPGGDRCLPVPEPLIDAVSSQKRVSGAPHDFYRYPARFSPIFAREAIKAFTQPGELVLDPFCGGGTTLVEAVALGRRAAGMDVSSLAAFLSRTKTTPISVHDRRELESWVSCLRSEKSYDDAFGSISEFETPYYERNLPDEALTFFRWARGWIELLPKARQQNFARLILVGVGQWGLDCKTILPTAQDLKVEFCDRLMNALEEFFDFLSVAARNCAIPRCRLGSLRRVINRSSEDCSDEGRIPKSWLPAKLVLTSPPYPGVHVVYHRWQVLGRKETPAPFMIANQRDGAGESHYLLGPRSENELITYYQRLRNVFASLRTLVSEQSTVVQLVAFSDPVWQLPEYLKVMRETGFHELTPTVNKEAEIVGRIWRDVPGRKWYTTNREIPASREVLLLHRPG